MLRSCWHGIARDSVSRVGVDARRAEAIVVHRIRARLSDARISVTHLWHRIQRTQLTLRNARRLLARARVAQRVDLILRPLSVHASRHVVARVNRALVLIIAQNRRLVAFARRRIAHIRIARIVHGARHARRVNARVRLARVRRARVVVVTHRQQLLRRLASRRTAGVWIAVRHQTLVIRRAVARRVRVHAHVVQAVVHCARIVIIAQRRNGRGVLLRVHAAQLPVTARIQALVVRRARQTRRTRHALARHPAVVLAHHCRAQITLPLACQVVRIGPVVAVPVAKRVRGIGHGRLACRLIRSLLQRRAVRVAHGVRAVRLVVARKVDARTLCRLRGLERARPVVGQRARCNLARRRVAHGHAGQYQRVRDWIVHTSARHIAHARVLRTLVVVVAVLGRRHAPSRRRVTAPRRAVVRHWAVHVRSVNACVRHASILRARVVIVTHRQQLCRRLVSRSAALCRIAKSNLALIRRRTGNVGVLASIVRARTDCALVAIVAKSIQDGLVLAHRYASAAFIAIRPIANVVRHTLKRKRRRRGNAAAAVGIRARVRRAEP